RLYFWGRILLVVYQRGGLAVGAGTRVLLGTRSWYLGAPATTPQETKRQQAPGTCDTLRVEPVELGRRRIGTRPHLPILLARLVEVGDDRFLHVGSLRGVFEHRHEAIEHRPVLPPRQVGDGLFGELFFVEHQPHRLAEPVHWDLLGLFAQEPQGK